MDENKWSLKPLCLVELLLSPPTDPHFPRRWIKVSLCRTTLNCSVILSSQMRFCLLLCNHVNSFVFSFYLVFFLHFWIIFIQVKWYSAVWIGRFTPSPMIIAQILCMHPILFLDFVFLVFVESVIDYRTNESKFCFLVAALIVTVAAFVVFSLMFVGLAILVSLRFEMSVWLVGEYVVRELCFV